MINYVIAVVIGIWFFQSARAKGEQPWKWALIGAVSFAGIAILSINVSLRLASPIRQEDLAATVITLMIASFGLAFFVSFLIHRKYLQKSDQEHALEENHELDSD